MTLSAQLLSLRQESHIHVNSQSRQSFLPCQHWGSKCLASCLPLKQHMCVLCAHAFPDVCLEVRATLWSFSFLPLGNQTQVFRLLTWQPHVLLSRLTGPFALTLPMECPGQTKALGQTDVESKFACLCLLRATTSSCLAFEPALWGWIELGSCQCTASTLLNKLAVSPYPQLVFNCLKHPSTQVTGFMFASSVAFVY